MKVDVLVAEIGSTTTLVSAFNNLDTDPVLIAQGQYRTTIAEDDINIGLNEAINDLKQKNNLDTICDSLATTN